MANTEPLDNKDLKKSKSTAKKRTNYNSKYNIKYVNGVKHMTLKDTPYN
jgi:hypothetical protein